MKRVGVREFKDKATSFIAKEESLVIERHGNPVGFYIPIAKKDREGAKEAVAQLEKTITKVRKDTGLTENELVDLFTKDWEENVNTSPKVKVGNASRR
jgi:hypothetical protein